MDSSLTSRKEQHQQHEDQQPLGQRTTGRRYRRRQERQYHQQQQENEDDDEMKMGTERAAAASLGERNNDAGAARHDDEHDRIEIESHHEVHTEISCDGQRQQSQQHERHDGNEPNENERARRAPMPEIESQIDAAIEARIRQRNQLMVLQPEMMNTMDVNREHHHPQDPNDDDDDNRNNQIEIFGKYEYLDHTADVQIHSWGTTLEECLEYAVMGMFGYMTDLSNVSINDKDSQEHGHCVTSQGHDYISLTFNFMQEWLCIFHETGFVPRRINVVEIVQSDSSNSCGGIDSNRPQTNNDNREDLNHHQQQQQQQQYQLQQQPHWTISSHGYGELFDPSKHVQGTEVKAITYSNLQVVMADDDNELDELDDHDEDGEDGEDDEDDEDEMDNHNYTQDNGGGDDDQAVHDVKENQHQEEEEKRCEIWVIVDI